MICSQNGWEKPGQSSRFEDISSPRDPSLNHRGASLIQTTTEILCRPETLPWWPQTQWGAWATQRARAFGQFWSNKGMRTHTHTPQTILFWVSNHHPQRGYQVIFFPLNCRVYLLQEVRICTSGYIYATRPHTWVSDYVQFPQRASVFSSVEWGNGFFYALS